MLLTGNLEKCWQLSSAASRVCVALGGQHLASLASSNTESESRYVRYDICLTYMLDKALSMSLNRAASLPDMKLNVSQLIWSDPAKPFTGLVTIYLELNQVQDAIIRPMRNREEPQKRIERVQCLQRKMWEIQTRINEVRACGRFEIEETANNNNKSRLNLNPRIAPTRI